MKKICLETWPRREAFEYFSRVSNPFYSLSFTLDVTNLYRFAKAQGLSFYYALIYLCTKALDRVDAFRVSVRGGELIELDGRTPSFTDLKKGAEQFHIVTLPCRGGIEEFCRAAKEKSAAQLGFTPAEPDGDDMIYFSCLPWLELTAVTNERDFNRDDSIPRLVWGRYRDEAGRKTLCLSMDLNHRFVDGFHAGRFHDELAKSIGEL